MDSLATVATSGGRGRDSLSSVDSGDDGGTTQSDAPAHSESGSQSGSRQALVDEMAHRMWAATRCNRRVRISVEDGPGNVAAVDFRRISEAGSNIGFTRTPPRRQMATRLFDAALVQDTWKRVSKAVLRMQHARREDKSTGSANAHVQQQVDTLDLLMRKFQSKLEEALYQAEATAREATSDSYDRDAATPSVPQSRGSPPEDHPYRELWKTLSSIIKMV